MLTKTGEKLKTSFIFCTVNPNKFMLCLLNILFLNCSYSDLRVFRSVTGAMTTCKVEAEHGPNIHVATEEPTCPLRAADPPKSGLFRHKSPSLSMLSLVLVARDRGLWVWCGLRGLFQVSLGSCFPPGEEVVPAATSLLAEGPMKGPTRTRQAGPGVEREQWGEREWSIVLNHL